MFDIGRPKTEATYQETHAEYAHELDDFGTCVCGGTHRADDTHSYEAMADRVPTATLARWLRDPEIYLSGPEEALAGARELASRISDDGWVISR
jgi:hypothetical protein